MSFLNYENLVINSQTKPELTKSALQSLFVLNGYKRYEMSSFENYELYHEHRAFLKSSGIITFNDAHGRLKALKPDVTMSIIKHTADGEKQSKLYYIENVFRTAGSSGDIREISQMGVEYIGGDDLYAEVEIIDLAIKSLNSVSEEFILTISHAGFVTSFIDSLNIENTLKENILIAISEKNTHTLLQISQENNFEKQQKDALIALASVFGDFNNVLAEIKQYICTNEMQNAYNSLLQLKDSLNVIGANDKIRLDFSALSAQDAKYYNGIILQGFIKGLPRAVLTGGRYDNLMRFFGKKQNAIGFAFILSEIERSGENENKFDFDIALIYNEECKPNTVLTALHKLQNEGKTVHAISNSKLPLAFSAQFKYILSETGELNLC